METPRGDGDGGDGKGGFGLDLDWMKSWIDAHLTLAALDS